MLRRAAVLVTSLVFAVTACKSPEEKAAEDAAKRLEEASKNLEKATQSGEANMGDAMAALGAAMGAATGGKQVETVDFRTLKDLLPGSVSGMNRTEATGEKSAAMGMQVSTAHANFQNDQGSSLKVTITDIGSMTGLAGMAAYAWAMTDIDRETSTGYEKTTRFNGHKAMEKYDNQTKYGELSVLVGDRFVVAAEGNAVSMNDLKGALNQVNLGKLESMKGQGVK